MLFIAASLILGLPMDATSAPKPSSERVDNSAGEIHKNEAGADHLSKKEARKLERLQRKQERMERRMARWEKRFERILEKLEKRGIALGENVMTNDLFRLGVIIGAIGLVVGIIFSFIVVPVAIIGWLAFTAGLILIIIGAVQYSS